MAKRVYCIVVNVTDGAAFAVREDNDESIYIPASIVEALELEEMDRLCSVIIQNDRNHDSTPWLMRRAMIVDDEGNRIDFEEEEA